MSIGSFALIEDTREIADATIHPKIGMNDMNRGVRKLFGLAYGKKRVGE